jgi:hypothetical protein
MPVAATGPPVVIKIAAMEGVPVQMVECQIVLSQGNVESFAKA